MGASEGQVILFNVMWTESWGVLRCPDNSDMPNWQEAGCELSGRRRWLFVLNQFSHYHSAQTSSKVTSSKRAWLWQKFCRGYRIQILAHLCRAQCARWGKSTFNCCNSGHAGSAACLQNHKTPFKMLPSHILNSIGGSVWRNCWETNSSFVLVDDSTVLSGRISTTNSSAALAWSSDAGQGRRMGREVWKRKTLSPLPG